MSSPRSILINVELSAQQIARVREAAPGAQVVSRDELREQPRWWGEGEALITHLFSPERLANAGKLRWIQTAGAGVDWLLTPELRARRDITVTNASGVHADPIAEHCIMLMLALTRELPLVLAQQREGRWDSDKLRELPTLAGRTLGILGVGAIGQRLAQLGAAFGMNVIGLRRSAEPVAFVQKMLGPEQLPELLREAHYVVNVLPATAQTRGLIGAEQLAQMRRDAVILNVGRGNTIDTDALVSALREQRIAGAALDVTDPEPLPPEHALWKLPNVIITPHYSGGRAGYLDAVLDVFVDNISRYREQRPLRNVVDIDAGY